MTAFDWGDIGDPLWEALEDLEDDFMEIADGLRGRLVEWSAAAARGELSLDELKELLEGALEVLQHCRYGLRTARSLSP